MPPWKNIRFSKQVYEKEYAEKDFKLFTIECFYRRKERRIQRNWFNQWLWGGHKSKKLVIYYFEEKIHLWMYLFICNAKIEPRALSAVGKHSLPLNFSTRPKLYFREKVSEWIESNWEIKMLKMKNKSLSLLTLMRIVL